MKDAQFRLYPHGDFKESSAAHPKLWTLSVTVQSVNSSDLKTGEVQLNLLDQPLCISIYCILEPYSWTVFYDIRFDSEGFK